LASGGRGDGPAVFEFNISPANLKSLGQKHDGKYPGSYVSQVIEIEPRDAEAHGSKTCPSGGTLSKSIGDITEAKLRIHNLSAYVETLQAK
jgi:hypothetical protein